VHEEPPRLVNAGWLGPLLESTMTLEPEDRWSMGQVRDYLEAGPTGTVVRPAPTGAADPGRTRVMSSAVPPVDPAPTPAEPTPTAPPPPEPPATAEPAPALAPEPRQPAGPRKRQGAVLPVLVALAALLVVGLLAWAILSNGDGSPEQTADQPSDTPTPSATSRSPSQSATSASPSPSPSPRPTAAGMEEFIEDYLATVTEDPRATFAMLTPEFQAASQGFRGYQSFWSTIEDAEPISVSADPDTLTVNYRVAYERTDGSDLVDEVSLQLVFEDGRYLIAGES
jgi:hypothetical protein